MKETNSGLLFHTALDLPQIPGVTALVGGGGKTSLMYCLGAEQASLGRTAIVTTTTRIGDPPPGAALLRETNGPKTAADLRAPGQVLCVCSRGEDGKLHNPGAVLWRRCRAAAVRMFVEADGARMLPVKVPDAEEPCLPSDTDTVVAVAGLSALGKPVAEIAFRLELLCRRFGVSPQTILTPPLLARILTSPLGQFKGVGSAERFRIFLNQADDAEHLRLGAETADWIQTFLPGCRVAVGCLLPRRRVEAVFPPK